MKTISNSFYTVAALLLSTIVIPAQATVIKELNFNVDGVLPSVDPDIELFNNSGVSEPSIFTVSGGLLTQETFAIDGNVSYQFPDSSLTNGGLDPSLTTVIEARLRINQIEGLGGAVFQAFDSVNRYTARFNPDGIWLQTTSGNVLTTIDTSDFHTFRLESPGNSNVVKLFVDGGLMLTETAASVGFNGFDFGDGQSTQGRGADVEWDWIRVSQMPIPEPASSLILGAGVLGFISRRRVA